MKREYIFIRHLTWFFFLLHFESLYVIAEESGDEYSKGCAYLSCESGSQCIKRRFWCKDPPCPGMLYCSKSRKESLKGPLTCDTVRCSRGHVCIIKVRDCHWDEGCKQQIARCISEKEYHEGAASCAGFECPPEKRCILRETYCVNPPCKLIRSCAEPEDVQNWFDQCKSLNCTSKYECFLRRPENNCLHSWCTHTADCTLTIEDELISKYCRGWICPRSQKCVVRIVGPCKGFNCEIERSCRPLATSSVQNDANTNYKVVEQLSNRKTLVQMERELILQELERRNSQTSYPITEEEKPTLTTSTRRSSLRHTVSIKHDMEISLPHRPSTTTMRSSLITKSFESSTNKPDLTLPYSQSWWNYNKLSNNFTHIIKEITKPIDSSNDASLPVEERIESTTSRDAKKLEMPKKIYITSNALPFPIVLEGINFVGQNYPIWMKNDPHHTASLEIKDENGDAWEYYMPQEPYRILLPPYEPVILVEDASGPGQLFPFFTYAFDRPFDETAALISLPEIKSIDRNYTVADVETFVKDQTEDEKRSRISITRFTDNNNLATFNPSITMGQSDYSSRDEKLYGLANYPYDTISVDDIDKSDREYEGSPLNKILNEGNQSDIPLTFREGDEETNV